MSEVGYITHEEAMVKNFMKDPEYADYYLKAVLEDGDEYEVQRVQGWYKEAQTRIKSVSGWGNIVSKAEEAAKSGQNLDVIIGVLTRALGILKAAVPAGA